MLYNKIQVEFLVLPSGRAPAEEFFEVLDNKALAKIYRLVEILKQQGSLPMPHARKMAGTKDLWELRILSKGSAVRVFYVYAERSKIVFISGFIKKSQETPKREIYRALQYLHQSGVKL